MNDDHLDEILHTDPLLIAEKLTGQSYKEDDRTQSLGFGLLKVKADLLKTELEARGDTTFRNEIDRYLSIITEHGFHQVLSIPFTSPRYPNTPETFFVYFHYQDGLLLTFDTFNSFYVNSGKVYYNWHPDPDIERWRYTSSGHFHENVWVGDHDCREALIYNLNNLRSHGEFVTPWVASPRPWLIHHGDTAALPAEVPFPERSALYDSINAERAALLPAHVREACLL